MHLTEFHTASDRRTIGHAVKLLCASRAKEQAGFLVSSVSRRLRQVFCFSNLTNFQ